MKTYVFNSLILAVGILIGFMAGEAATGARIHYQNGHLNKNVDIILTHIKADNAEACIGPLGNYLESKKSLWDKLIDLRSELKKIHHVQVIER